MNADAAILAALLAGDSHTEAARSAGVSPSTVRRRLADDDFVAKLAEHRGAVMARCADRLAAGASSAVVVLVGLLEDDDSVSPAVRLGACRTLLDAAPKYQEHADLEARIAHLEALIPA